MEGERCVSSFGTDSQLAARLNGFKRVLCSWLLGRFSPLACRSFVFLLIVTGFISSASCRQQCSKDECEHK
ncbi:hypothetical protein D3C76_1845360 [compost metagenome]